VEEKLSGRSEGNSKELEEVFQATDYAIKQKAARAGERPEEYANGDDRGNPGK